MNEEIKGNYCTKSEAIAMKFDDEMTELLNINSDLEELDSMKKMYETKSKINVAEAKNEDGKSKYTNETQREAAISSDLEMNISYQEILKSYKEKRKKKAEIESIIEVLKFKLRSLEVISRIVSE